MPQSHDDDTTTLTLPSDNEILVTRWFDAPARLVWEAVTQPEHVSRWWAPRSRGQMLGCEVDLRVGGRWRYLMRTNAGGEVGFSGTFLEIEAPRKIVQTEIFDPFPQSVSTVTLTLVEEGGGTTMRMRAEYPSKFVRDEVIGSGMEGGMRESYLQLVALVASLR